MEEGKFSHEQQVFMQELEAYIQRFFNPGGDNSLLMESATGFSSGEWYRFQTPEWRLTTEFFDWGTQLIAQRAVALGLSSAPSQELAVINFEEWLNVYFTSLPDYQEHYHVFLHVADYFGVRQNLETCIVNSLHLFTDDDLTLTPTAIKALAGYYKLITNRDLVAEYLDQIKVGLARKAATLGEYDGSPEEIAAIQAYLLEIQ